MRALTLRNIPPEIARAVQNRAQRLHTSLNRAVLGLLEETLGIVRKKGAALHHDLDHLAGTWSAKEAGAFDESLARQRMIDPELWK